jgi:hypothetical protein
MEPGFVKNRLALLLERFGKIPGPRDPPKVRFPLREVLFLVTCASVAGLRRLRGDRRVERDQPAVPAALWGILFRDAQGGLAADPDEPHRPSAVRGVFYQLGAVAAAGRGGPDRLGRQEPSSQRRQRRGQAPLHLVSAFTQRLVLAQEPIDAKENECAAMLEILARLSVKGALVTRSVSQRALAANGQLRPAWTLAPLPWAPS